MLFMAVVAVLMFLLAIVVLVRQFSAEIYDSLIVHMTAQWYAAVFARLHRGDRVLDVGIGTATALVRNKTELLKKHISLVGIDYEEAYVRKAEAVLCNAELHCAVPAYTDGYRPKEFYCRVLHRSVYDAGLGTLCATDAGAVDVDQSLCEGAVPEDLRFDAVYFSGSLTLMPDPAAALQAVAPVMKDGGGRVFITQTFSGQRSSCSSLLKPLLKYITSVDFGQETTFEDLDCIIADSGVFKMAEKVLLEGASGVGCHAAHMIVLRKKSLKERIQEWRRQLQSELRKLERNISGLSQEENKCKREMKSLVKRGQQPAAKSLARQILRSRAAADRLKQTKTKLAAVQLRLTNEEHSSVSALQQVDQSLLKDIIEFIDIPEIAKIAGEVKGERRRAQFTAELADEEFDNGLEHQAEIEIEQQVQKLLDELAVDASGSKTDDL
mmetsp:Transcript_42309/g.75809  ORF Transcript_42309/g.75809 Transcript_42309/m.75809 type:complete len:439 (+) Transcript_42309:112-1428(+)